MTFEQGFFTNFKHFFVNFLQRKMHNFPKNTFFITGKYSMKIFGKNATIEIVPMRSDPKNSDWKIAVNLQIDFQLHKPCSKLGSSLLIAG